MASIATSTVTDWSGAYVGLSYSDVSGTMTFSNQPFTYYYTEDAAFGVFSSYNWQRGKFVYGFELNATQGLDGLQGFPGEGLGHTTEFRGRSGYAIGDALAYGFLGYGAAVYADFANSWDVNGITYGVGVDYMITDNIFAGLEFSRREM